MNALPTPAPILFGLPVATLALIAASLSFVVAAFALSWQIWKHRLDGGRVRVYLNASVWEPNFGLFSNNSGRFIIEDERIRVTVDHRESIEVAQLVVENPGRIPVTIYAPSLEIRSGGRNGSRIVTPRMLGVGDDFGAEMPRGDMVVRLEPYDRVTFLLDVWSQIRPVHSKPPYAPVSVRGHVSVAGRRDQPQRSSRRLRWIIAADAFTVRKGSPDLVPYSILWRHIFLAMPGQEETRNGGLPAPRANVGFYLEQAMGRFPDRPEVKLFSDTYIEIAKRDSLRFPGIRSAIFAAYIELNRLDGHLEPWLTTIPPSEKADKGDVGPASEGQSGT